MPLTIDNLKNAFYGEQERKLHRLIEVAEEHSRQVENMIGVKYVSSTHSHYKTTITYLKEFLQYQYQKKDVPLKEVNYKFCELFFEFLTTRKPCKTNGANKHFKRLKTIINYAIKQEYISVSPMRGYVSFTPYNRVALTLDEIKSIEDLKLQSDALIETQDMYLLQCYTGLPYQGIKALSKDDIQLINGKQWIKKERQKTGIEFAVPLLKPVIKILDKYFRNSDILPVLSNQKMNVNLKIIQELAGIKKNLTTHLARHTFATTITLSNGVPIETVSKMLGHTRITTTQIYSKVLDNKIEADMKGLKSKFNGKKQKQGANEAACLFKIY